MTTDYAAPSLDLDRSALEIETSRELVVQVWRLAHRIAEMKAAEKQEERHAEI